MSVLVCVLVMILSLWGSVVWGYAVAVGSSGMSDISSFAVFSLWFRYCLFLFTWPVGVDPTYDVGVPALDTTLPGVWLWPVQTHTVVR